MSIIDIRDHLPPRERSRDDDHLERVLNQLLSVMQASDLESRFLILMTIEALMITLLPADASGLDDIKKQITQTLNAVTVRLEPMM